MKIDKKIDRFVTTLRDNDIFVMTGGRLIGFYINGEESQIICSEQTNGDFLIIQNCKRFDNMYTPNTIIEYKDINKFIKTILSYKALSDDNLLSKKALKWLKTIDYSNMCHKERLILFEAAKTAYPK